MPTPAPGLLWSVTFADGGGRTRAVHAPQRVGVNKGLRRARIQVGDTAELHGNGAVVDLDFGEKRVGPSLLHHEDQALAR